MATVTAVNAHGVVGANIQCAKLSPDYHAACENRVDEYIQLRDSHHRFWLGPLSAKVCALPSWEREDGMRRTQTGETGYGRRRRGDGGDAREEQTEAMTGAQWGEATFTKGAGVQMQ